MDISITMGKANDEVGVLSQNFSTMKEIVSNIHQDVRDLVENATAGNLSYRANPDKYPGDWREVIIEFNELMNTIMLPIDETADTLQKISGGDFNARIISEYRGDFDRIKKAVNSTAIDLDRYLAEKTNAEKELFEAEQKANRAKSEFLFHMSHEIRTPINAIIGMTKIAENTEDISRLKYCLNTISVSSVHLLGIINDVLDMSKIEAGKFELENVPMNIDKVLSKVSNIISGNIAKKSQKFSIETDDNLHRNYIADDLRLSQVLTNLLGNAVKFTPEGGKITLRVKEIARDERTNTLHFLVADTGVGMTDKQISRLFNAFEQADGSISRRFGGTGLGLAISKSIVEKMGGCIWVESEPDAGSTFGFEVCFERISSHYIMLGSSETETDKSTELADLSGIHIILAEDIEVNQEIFIALLENTKISIDIAENGLIAVSKFKENPDKYDLIIMDVHMPVMDGYQATKAIRETGIPKAKSIPIIALTASAFKEDIDRCVESGMNDHLSKPIVEKDVIEKIKLYARRVA